MGEERYRVLQRLDANENAILGICAGVIEAIVTQVRAMRGCRALCCAQCCSRFCSVRYHDLQLLPLPNTCARLSL